LGGAGVFLDDRLHIIITDPVGGGLGWV
jgi:hypothetical protein